MKSSYDTSLEVMAKNLVARAFEYERLSGYALAPSYNGLKISTAAENFYRIGCKPEDCDGNPNCPFFGNDKEKDGCKKIPVARGHIQNELPLRCTTIIEKVRCI